MVAEEIDTDNYTEMALFEKIEAIELPEDEDTSDWTDEDWDERFEKVAGGKALMVEEEMAEEEGWTALPFAPELQPLYSGVFLASSVDYCWPGYLPGDEDDEDELREEFIEVSKVVKIVKQGNVWKLLGLWEDDETLLFSGLAGEDNRVVRRGVNSMRILDTGELLLTRKCLVPGLDYGGPDFKGASYTLYSPI